MKRDDSASVLLGKYKGHKELTARVYRLMRVSGKKFQRDTFNFIRHASEVY